MIFVNSVAAITWTKGFLPNRYLVFGRAVMVGPNTNSGHLTSVSANAIIYSYSRGPSEIFSVADELPKKLKKDDFWTSWD